MRPSGPRRHWGVSERLHPLQMRGSRLRFFLKTGSTTVWEGLRGAIFGLLFFFFSLSDLFLLSFLTFVVFVLDIMKEEEESSQLLWGGRGHGEAGEEVVGGEGGHEREGHEGLVVLGGKLRSCGRKRRAVVGCHTQCHEGVGGAASRVNHVVVV